VNRLLGEIEAVYRRRGADFFRFALARIGEGAVRCAALCDDASVAICEESGAISLARLATHLSIVTT